MVKKDKAPDIIPVAWPGEKGRTSIRVPRGLKGGIDELLEFITEKTGVKVTRNEFCINAFKFYFDHLTECATVNEMLGKLKSGK